MRPQGPIPSTGTHRWKHHWVWLLVRGQPRQVYSGTLVRVRLTVLYLGMLGSPGGLFSWPVSFTGYSIGSCFAYLEP